MDSKLLDSKPLAAGGADKLPKEPAEVGGTDSKLPEAPVEVPAEVGGAESKLPEAPVEVPAEVGGTDSKLPEAPVEVPVEVGGADSKFPEVPVEVPAEVGGADKTKQNAETGETTSQGIASGTTLITNGLSEDLPAPPPELIENGHEPTVERVTVSEVESEVKNIESDAIYDIPDAVPVLTTDSGSVKSGSEKSESDKQETNSIKTGSVKSEKVESEKGDSEKAESEKAESEKGDSEKAESERAESEKAESEKAESDIVAVVKSDIESIKAEANISNNEVAGTAKSYITKIPLDDLDSSPSFVKAVREPKEIDVSDPLNFVNVSAEEMKQKILSKKKARKFKDMNLKEKHEILDRL